MRSIYSINRLHLWLVVVSAILFIFVTKNSLALQVKHVAVPAQDVEKQQLKSTNTVGVFSHSTILPVSILKASEKVLNATGSVIEINQKIYVDAKENSPIMFVGPDSEQWYLMLTDPNGKEVHNGWDKPETTIAAEDISIGGQVFKGKQYILSAPTVGAWNIKLLRNVNHKQTNAHSITDVLSDENVRRAYLFIKGDEKYQLYSYLDEQITTQNNDINIVAYMVDTDNNPVTNRNQLLTEKPLQGVITTAIATITTPGNKTVAIVLRDDGLKGDKIAGDGLYSGKVPSSEVGVYSSEIHVEGIRPDGIEFSRTTTDLYPIEVQSYRFKNTAAELNKTGEHSAIISVPVEPLNDTPSVFMAAEVWGTADNGQMKLATWIGGIVSVTEANKGARLGLNFDTRWLQRERIQAPFELRSVRLQTVSSNTPIALLDQLELITSKRFNQAIQKTLHQNSGKNYKIPITNEMLMGRAPAMAKAQVGTAAGKLMLVHGYCSDLSWRPRDFSNTVQFKDPQQNRSHDEFAKKIQAFGANLSSFGIVAHSQGGAAALHLLAKYWTGLDKATGGRKIQSLGTPYQGSALAGNLAVLGKIFGVGCGKNTDLTYTGAANWLATIPNWARAEVDYYTTSFATKPWRYDYCELASDLLLRDPEDGVTEQWAGQLPGGVNKGHKKGWCHSKKMRDPVQYYDTHRNTIMNNNAAR